jgi:DNA-binding transcriptional LysR family regulator
LKEIEFLRDPGAGELRIAAHTPMIYGIVPVIVDRLRHRYPKLVFDITEAVSVPAFWLNLRERNVDFIIGRVPALGDDDLDVDILFEDSQYVVAGPQSRWAQRRKIDLAELINEPWILPKPNTSGGAVIAATFAASGLQVPRPEVTCGSFPMMNSLLARSPLLAFWPNSVLHFGVENFSVKVLPVKLPPLPRPVGIITLKGRTISPAARIFIECAREIATSLRASKW